MKQFFISVIWYDTQLNEMVTWILWNKFTERFQSQTMKKKKTNLVNKKKNNK